MTQAQATALATLQEAYEAALVPLDDRIIADGDAAFDFLGTSSVVTPRGLATCLRVVNVPRPLYTNITPGIAPGTLDLTGLTDVEAGFWGVRGTLRQGCATIGEAEAMDRLRRHAADTIAWIEVADAVREAA